MSEKNGEREKFRISAVLVFIMLVAGMISVTLLTAMGKTDSNTYEKVMNMLLAYVAGFASAYGTMYALKAAI